MDTESVIKAAKLKICVGIVVSIGLFITWFIFETSELSFSNHKVFIALSLIPFSVSLVSFLKLMKLNKYPQTIVAETDERLVAEKNEADAKTLKIIQGTLFLIYLSYTFVIPDDIFKTIGWWMTLLVLLISLFLPLLFRYLGRKQGR
ncbi:hypothetical protein SAMN04488134_101173 [Amphibacillus marinus]|uniref:DUF2178 domain-containing protein n=1 Tax=Amphibacillus marinus TaxID=872970 RepID=A0A1H8GVU7_9BACI|nr:hypothetical protein [Amphibacillus marinus]SEN47597.1 hypothetical protein SAMN04488134_101173 [Amphibacillus marinus]